MPVDKNKCDTKAASTMGCVTKKGLGVCGGGFSVNTFILPKAPVYTEDVYVTVFGTFFFAVSSGKHAMPWQCMAG